MKRIAWIITFLASATFAVPPNIPQRAAHMAAECRAVMERGVCRVQNSSPMPAEMRSVPWRLGFGLGTVSTGDYMDIQDAGQGMCELVEPACNADWDGARCRVIRSLWKQE